MGKPEKGFSGFWYFLNSWRIK